MPAASPPGGDGAHAPATGAFAPLAGDGAAPAATAGASPPPRRGDGAAPAATAGASPPPRRWVAALLAHPRHVVLAGLAGGMAGGPRLPAVVAALALAVAAVALAAAASAGAIGGRVAVLLAGAGLSAAAGGGIAAARLRALDRTALGPWAGHAADLRAILLQPPRPRSFGRVAALAEIRSGPGSGERVVVVAKGSIPGAVGDELHVTGGFRPLSSFEQAMRRAGAHAQVAADAVTRTGRRRGGLPGAVDGIRRRADRALAAGLPPPLDGLARGMVLGEDAALPPAMSEDFRAAGLAHLVAASGANVALLAALVFALCAGIGMPRTPRLWIALVAIAAYVPLAGGGPSIQRAGVMGAAAVVAALASQPASRSYALLLAATGTLAANPRSAEDPGWQLSFAAVVALLLLVPPLRDRLARRLPRPVADAAAVSLVAAAATTPVIAVHFGRFSWVTVPANLIAAPAVAPVMWLGTLAALAGQVAPTLAVPFTATASWPLAFLAWVGQTAAALPGAQTDLALPPWAAAVWLGALLAAGSARVRRGAGRVARRVVRPLTGRGAARATAGAAPARRGRIARANGRLAVLAFGLAALAAVAARLLAPHPPPPPRGLAITALDVGQGDATLIRHGRRAILVDTGPPDGGVVDRLRALGVSRLDLLVITHAQLDHDGGAAAVLSALRVDAVLDGRDGVRTPEGDRFAAAARSQRVRLIRPAAGQRLRAGPLRLDVLSPRAEPAALDAGEDPNRRAIVAELRDGRFSMLLPADAESDVLGALPLGPVDVLKVSHHGSADPGLPSLLERLRPQAALIEVGARNRYGHPAATTLAALRSAGVRVLRTDVDGTLTIQPPT